MRRTPLPYLSPHCLPGYFLQCRECCSPRKLTGLRTIGHSDLALRETPGPVPSRPTYQWILYAPTAGSFICPRCLHRQMRVMGDTHG